MIGLPVTSTRPRFVRKAGDSSSCTICSARSPLPTASAAVTPGMNWPNVPPLDLSRLNVRAVTTSCDVVRRRRHDRAAAGDVPERRQDVVDGQRFAGADRLHLVRHAGAGEGQRHVDRRRAAVVDAHVGVEVRERRVELRHAGNDEALRGNLRRIGGEDQQRIGGGVVEHRGVGADVAGVAGHAHFHAAVGDATETPEELIEPLLLRFVRLQAVRALGDLVAGVIEQRGHEVDRLAGAFDEAEVRAEAAGGAALRNLLQRDLRHARSCDRKFTSGSAGMNWPNVPVAATLYVRLAATVARLMLTVSLPA